MPIKNDHTKECKELMEAGIQRALEAAGLQTESYARLELSTPTAHKTDPSPRPHVDTGTLRNSITHQTKTDEQAVYIGTNTEYGVYVHEGHTTPSGGNVPPFRFLKNAIEKNETVIKALIESELRRG